MSGLVTIDFHVSPKSLTHDPNQRSGHVATRYWYHVPRLHEKVILNVSPNELVVAGEVVWVHWIDGPDAIHPEFVKGQFYVEVHLLV